jgi:hypothetical protein
MFRARVSEGSNSPGDGAIFVFERPVAAEAHIPARMAEAIAYLSSVVERRVTAQLVAETKRDRRSGSAPCPIGEIANVVVGLRPLSQRM